MERVVAMTLESIPRDATHWSRRSVAAASGISPATVGHLAHHVMVDELDLTAFHAPYEGDGRRNAPMSRG